MQEAREFAKQHPNTELGIILAATQRCARGRGGNAWISPEGGFFATYIWSVNVPAAKLAGVSLVVGLAVAEAIEQFGAMNSKLKWPNDLLIGEKKLAGILIETEGDSESSRVFMGIGINLKEAPVDAVSLRDSAGITVAPHEFAIELSPILLTKLRRFVQEGLTPFKGPWLKRACWIDRQIQFSVGGEDTSGVLKGIADDGSLLVEISGKLKSFASADHIRLAQDT
jgi:BirA family transcriptional regulator, biotin operon repressor / biotin---[acetyl-CoA-carboxylase] ligase